MVLVYVHLDQVFNVVIENPESIDFSFNEQIVKITKCNGDTIESSPSNIIIVTTKD